MQTAAGLAGAANRSSRRPRVRIAIARSMNRLASGAFDTMARSLSERERASRYLAEVRTVNEVATGVVVTDRELKSPIRSTAWSRCSMRRRVLRLREDAARRASARRTAHRAARSARLRTAVMLATRVLVNPVYP